MSTDVPAATFLDGPPRISASDLALSHRVDWRIGPDDVMAIVDIAAKYNVTRATFDSMLVRRAKYRRLDGFPDPVVKGIYPAALVRLHLDPTWRPEANDEAGTTGAIWRDLGVLVVPEESDVVTLAQLAVRLRITRSALRAALSDGQKTPRRLGNLPSELVPAAKVMVWSRREIDAWFETYAESDEDLAPA